MNIGYNPTKKHSNAFKKKLKSSYLKWKIFKMSLRQSRHLRTPQKRKRRQSQRA